MFEWLIEIYSAQDWSPERVESSPKNRSTAEDKEAIRRSIPELVIFSENSSSFAYRKMSSGDCISSEIPSKS